MALLTRHIRPYLTDAYSDEELGTLCFDYFPDVYENFTAGMTKRQKIQLLLEHCQHHGLLPSLEGALEQDRPGQLRAFVGRAYQEKERAVECLASLFELQDPALEEETKAADEELKGLESVDADPNRCYLNWEDMLPEINFGEAVSKAQKIIGQFGQQGSAAVFLLRNYNSMGGKWCVDRIKRLLPTAHFKSLPVELSLDKTWDEQGVLNGLWGHLRQSGDNDQDRQQCVENVRQYAQKIIQRICRSLQNGSVVFIELSLSDKSGDKSNLCDQILRPFLEDFWRPLVRDQIRLIDGYLKVRFVLLILVKTPIVAGNLPPDLAYTGDVLDMERVLELPLRLWTLDEIRDWLATYSGLELQGSEIMQMADEVYQTSWQGLPALVYKELDDIFRRYVR